MADQSRDADPASNAPPLLDERPPTAMLPADRRAARELSGVPPTPPPAEPLSRPGIAPRLLPEEAQRRRLTSEEILRVGVGAGRVLALTAGFVVGDVDWSSGTIGLLSLAAVVTVLRVVVARRPLLAIAIDTAIAALLLTATNGTNGPFALYGAASAIGVGATAGMALGLSAAAVLAAVGVLAGPGVDVTEQARATVVAWIALYPIGAALGALLSNLLRSQQAMLMTTNRILGDLERLTSVAPQSLSPAKVASEAAAEFRRVLDGQVAIVLFEREGTMLELGRDGPHDAGPHLVLESGWEDLVTMRGPRRVDIGSFPVRLVRQVPALAQWWVVPLRARDARVGLVLVGCDETEDSRARRAQLGEMAVETAVALDNTQLFSRIEHAATATERQRLASDLHDGVAQQLTHVRFELELLARRTQDEAMRQELDRIARVAHRATDDVRAAIRGLQAAALAQGLVPAMRALVADLDGASGPVLELDVRGAAELDEDTGAELYRIVQEALSNALRHAQAKHVVVEMDVVDDTLVLAVEDDGVGLGGRERRDGLGLRSMRARAGRIGATCTVRDADDGGTRVEVRLALTGGIE